MEKLKGKVWKFGDNVDTDVIIPAKYLNLTDANDLAKHCMETADSEFPNKASKGDIMAAGNNFGCGSSREHAPLCIKALGISAVLANSFARIFFRNAINTGLPVFECPEAVTDAEQGDELELNPQNGEIKNLTKNKTYKVAPLPEEIQKIIAAGGLMNYVKETVS